MGTASVAGAYVPLDTPVHRLDARAKLGLLLVWTVALFCIDEWWTLAFVALALLVVLRVAGVAVAQAARAASPLVLVLAVIVCAAALRFDGSAAWQVAGGVGVDPDGLVRGLRTAARIVLMVALSLAVSASTTAGSLSGALLWAMAPLRRLQVPVDDVATMLSVAVRFIPVCSEQLGRIALAQRARGARVGEGGPVRAVMSWVPVIIPLFVAMFRRSEALAGAMQARCYRGAGRTVLEDHPARPVDVLAFAVGTLVAVALALVC